MLTRHGSVMPDVIRLKGAFNIMQFGRPTLWMVVALARTPLVLVSCLLLSQISAISFFWTVCVRFWND